MALLEYKASKTLAKFHQSDAFVRCVVGPVGSGKSSGMVIELLARAVRQEPDSEGVRRTRWCVVRNTYPQLRDTVRKTFEQWIPTSIGHWHEQSFTFVIDKELDDGTKVYSEVMFRALDRPEDINKLLSLELTGAYINEAREIPKHVFDLLQTRVGRFPSRLQGGATWSGIWLDTNPWHTRHWGYKLFTKRENILPRHQGLYELYEQPGARDPDAENLENLDPAYYDRLISGKDGEWVRCYVDSKYPSWDEGSIFGPSVTELEQRGGLSNFEHPVDGVFTSWDLGMSDSTAIWWWRINEHGYADVIDHYEAHGQPMSHYFDIIDGRAYGYVNHWLPHDAKARTLASSVSIFEQFAERYGFGSIRVTPSLSLLDGIQAARWLLERQMRIHPRCGKGIDALREYRYKYDEMARVFSRTPEHNWASHTADAFRYLAIVVKLAGLANRPPEESEKLKPLPHPGEAFTMDDLWADREDRSGFTKRI